MSQFDKLLRRIYSLDRTMRFEEIQKILLRYGYEMSAPASGSSHRTFRKAGKYPITIPRHDPIKRIYVEKVRDAIESEERRDENDK